MKMFKIYCFLLIGITIISINDAYTQVRKKDIPSVHSKIEFKGGQLIVQNGDNTFKELEEQGYYTLNQLMGDPRGVAEGITFDFKNTNFSGTLYYGFIPYGDSDHPQPVFFRRSAKILGGKTFVEIKKTLSGRFDMISWQENGKGTLGYRVVNSEGMILYDGRVSFTGVGPFKVGTTFTEGPFVNLITPEGATISLSTNKKAEVAVEVNEKMFPATSEGNAHEILITGLQPDTEYTYTVIADEQAQTYTFRTAPKPGTRTPFSFSYASDSRSGQGGGERDVFGANFYIMKKIMALNSFKNIRFMQFSGDLIDGYLTSPEATDLQYANWKRAVEPFWHYFPIYISMGNHEALIREFWNEEGTQRISVDRFPYETQSAEVVFARNFVNPTNGPQSEDGASYDPNLEKMDFPPYSENVFYYTFDNVAVVVMNSDYFYAPSTPAIPLLGGGLHGYIMDEQLSWVEQTIAELERDENIDHIFITQHTPFFPNGGHVQDDMWYNGNNQYRPYVAGKPLPKGIIERRDQLLDLIVNNSSKVLAILTGDEHNYARTEVGPNTDIYLPAYPSENRIELSRTIWQINNGAAGAPYYAQEQTPWSAKVSGFTTQNALVFFHINGKNVELEVLNPDTLEEIDKLSLR